MVRLKRISLHSDAKCRIAESKTSSIRIPLGTAHQPLHASNDDRGRKNLAGPLRHRGSIWPTTELHAVWDVDEVLAVFNTLGDEPATVDALFHGHASSPDIVHLTPLDWACESNELARKDIYQAE